MSNVATFARPYARAAFALASQSSAFAAWSKSLQFSAAAALDPRVVQLIGHPRLAAEELVGVLAAPECTDEQLRFLAVLADNRRLALLTGRILEVPVGRGLLGRVVNTLGQPIDGKGPVDNDGFSPIEVAPRALSSVSLLTSRSRPV
jgi:hypothetical protein